MPVVTALKIPLRRRDGSVRAHALVSPEDEWAARYKWSLLNGRYVVRNNPPTFKPRLIYLHRELLGLVPGDGLEADHINRNPLDNRRENLRVATHRLNHQNRGPNPISTSRYRGVSWCGPPYDKWVAQAHMGGKTFNLGRYHSEEKAAEAAKQFRERHMPFAAN